MMLSIEMVAMKVSSGMDVGVDKNDPFFTVALNDFKRVRDLRSIYQSVVLKKVTIRLVQAAPVGHGQLQVGGLVHVGLVPSSWSRTEVLTKKYECPELYLFALGYENVLFEVFSPDISTFELDLAQIAKRGALPVFTILVAGAISNQKIDKLLGVQIMLELECAGEGYGA